MKGLTVTVCLCVYACFQVVHSQVPANGPFDLNNEPFDIDDDNLDRTLLLLNEGSQESTSGNGVCLAVGALLGLSFPIRSSEGSMMSVGQMMAMNVMNAMSSMMTGTAVTPVMPTVCPDPVVCPSPVSVPTCEFGWTLRGTRCYFFSGGTQLSWTAAQSSCQAMGGRLAELETIEEINAVKSVASVQNNRNFWIGGQRFGQGTFDFNWASTNQPISVTDWAPNQPNNRRGDQDCILLTRSNQYQWNDRPCTVTIQYICEKSAATAVCRN